VSPLPSHFYEIKTIFHVFFTITNVNGLDVNLLQIQIFIGKADKQEICKVLHKVNAPKGLTERKTFTTNMETVWSQMAKILEVYKHTEGLNSKVFYFLSCSTTKWMRK
jgi:hypothetical protein